MPALHLKRIGAFELDMHARELRGGATRIRLQSQPFEILRALLERPGDVVTRDELRRRLWPGGIFVDFEHSLNTAIKRLRAALGDNADQPTFVETVARRGYRYIAADPEPRRASRLRVVVLPFSAVSDGVECEQFSNGLTEEVIAQLGAVSRDVEIIAPWSSRYDPLGLQRVREIGEALHAGSVLEGSTRLLGPRARITARLVESTSEIHRWSETYDRIVDSPMSAQTDIGGAVARAVVNELTAQPARDGAVHRRS
jgi:TolB-like protein